MDGEELLKRKTGINPCDIIDMVGLETETYKVLYRDRERPNTTKAYWICYCKLCGSEFSVLGKYLRRGDQKSCGCRVGRRKHRKIVGKRRGLTMSKLTTKNIEDGSVDSSKIADSSVGLIDMASDSVNSSKIVDGEVALADMASDSVNSSKIVDGEVALADMASDSVNSSKIVDDSVLFSDLNLTSLKNSVATDGRITTVSYQEDDFVAGAATPHGWLSVVNGTGASCQVGTYGVNATEKALGVYQIDTGTATGRACLLVAATSGIPFKANYCSNDITLRVALEQLSNATQTFSAYVGFIDNSAAGDMVNAVYFRYTDAVNGGKWQGVTRTASVESTIDTGVLASTSYATFRIFVNAAGSSADFYINGSLVGSLTTNIPTASSIGIKIQKTVGVTQANMSMDYYYRKTIFTSARG